MTQEGEGARGEASVLLERWRAGDGGARDQLVALVHHELRAIAGRLMRGERAGHTLQPTAVVGEACLRLLRGDPGPAGSRAEFLGLASRVMRQVLVDHARKRDSDKRGGGWQRVSLASSSEPAGPSEPLVDVLDLDAALKRLEARSARQARIAELRYLAGMTIGETAKHLGISETLVKREWLVARAWLRRELGLPGPDGGNPAAKPDAP